MYLVRGDDDATGEPLFVLAQASQQLLVGRPGAAGHQNRAVVALQEALRHGVGLGGLGDLVHAVESGVAGEGGIDAVTGEQLEALLVLHEDVAVAEPDLFQEPTAMGSEEVLLRAEDGGEEVGGDLAAAELAEVVVPEFVFDEEGRHGAVGVEQAACVARGVHGEVGDAVGQGVVLAHLVARGGEEGEQDFGVGMPLAVGLEHGARLLELAQAGGMEPHPVVSGQWAVVSGQWAVVSGQCAVVSGQWPPLHHQARVAVAEERRQADAQRVEVDAQGVEFSHQ